MQLSKDLREFVELLNSRKIDLKELLVQNKLAAARPQDLADVTRLREIN
jgi:hypothetical protein